MKNAFVEPCIIIKKQKPLGWGLFNKTLTAVILNYSFDF